MWSAVRAEADSRIADIPAEIKLPGRQQLALLQDEWAYAHRWDSSQQRTKALRSFVRYYNRRRPHSSLGDRPPITRVHNVPDQDI